MLLVDALACDSHDGQTLLAYLREKLAPIEQCKILEAPSADAKLAAWSPISSTRKRDALLEATIDDLAPRTLFCFDSLPPRQPQPFCRVVNYVLDPVWTSPQLEPSLSLFERKRWRQTKRRIQRRMSHTNQWVFPTQHALEGFQKQFSLEQAACSVAPFFDEARLAALCDDRIDSEEPKEDAWIYLGQDTTYRNHARLLDAWELLADQYQQTPELRLSITESPSLTKRANLLLKRGLPIKTLGRLNPTQRAEEIAKCRYAIWPSAEETVALGLVESTLLDCYVLASHLPFLNDIVTPTATFDQASKTAIAETVYRTLQSQQLRKPVIYLRNEFPALLKILDQR